MKDIEGLEGLYAVTEDGRVWSYPKKGARHNGRFCKMHMTRKGYSCVSLRKTMHATVHRLVAKAFIPNPLHLPEVNHKNGVKTDNRVENLEWCTSSENKRHSLRIGTAGMKLTFEKAGQIRKLYVEGEKQNAIAKMFGIDQG